MKHHVFYVLRHVDQQWDRDTKSKWATKIALLMSGDDGMVQTALIVSLLASIAAAFPDAHAYLIAQAMAITATMMIPAMLLSSKLSQYFNKKKLILTGTVIFMLAGLAAGVAPNIYLLIATRALLGIGAGLSFPLVPTAIASLFRGREKNQMLGWMNACGGILSFVLGIGSGLIAEIDWRASFLLYLIFVPIIILQWFCLPDFKPEKWEPTEECARESKRCKKERINWKMWLTGICMLCFMCAMMTLVFKLSVFVETRGIGTPAASGSASSINTITAFAIALFFTTYLRVFRRYAPAVSMLFASLCFVFAALATDMFFIYLATICMGLCMGTINPYLFAIMSNIAPTTRKTIGMTMMCVFQLAGQIFTPYYMMAVAALGFVDERSLFGFTAGLFAVAAVSIAVLFSIKEPKAGVLHG